MFTGLIEQVLPLHSVQRMGQDALIRLDIASLTDGVALGDSIALNGICLTVARLDQSLATFQASAHTLHTSTAQYWKTGMAVNIERALRVGDRLGGHWVAGHVDGIGKISERRQQGDSVHFTLLLPENNSVQVVEKGSLAVDGISLTTWDCRGRRCRLTIITHTLTHTTLEQARPGSLVNLEQDLIGRWVQAGLGNG